MSDQFNFLFVHLPFTAKKASSERVPVEIVLGKCVASVTRMATRISVVDKALPSAGGQHQPQQSVRNWPCKLEKVQCDVRRMATCASVISLALHFTVIVFIHKVHTDCVFSALLANFGLRIFCESLCTQTLSRRSASNI